MRLLFDSCSKYQHPGFENGRIYNKNDLTIYRLESIISFGLITFGFI